MENLAVNYYNTRVFVTGATGFVGSRLVEALVAAGSDVTCIVRDIDPQSVFARSGVRESVREVRANVQDLASIERVINDYEPEVIFHLAAQTLVQPALRSPYEAFESNVRGTYTLLEAARRIGCARAIVVASSDKAYGALRGARYVEDMPLSGEHPYDVSKSCTDLIARTYHASYGMPVAVARCGNIYGGGDTNWSRIVPGTIRWLFDGEAPRIRSDGTLVRDYLHVEDVVRAYLNLGARAGDAAVAGEAFNFSAGAELTALEVVNYIRKAMNRMDIEPLIENTAKSEIAIQILDSTKAKRILGWQPRVNFESGIHEAIAWYSALLEDGRVASK
jgi:CDP-glucose 4,6-dehydratase